MTKFDEVTEKTLSNVIEYQFPEFFRTDGPVFVSFVKEYYKWLEGISNKATKIAKGTVTVQSKSVNVLGDSTSFLTDFVVGDGFAIYDDDGDYQNYIIESISDDVTLTLTTSSDISGSNLGYGTIESKPNVLYHTRRLFDYDDIDNTADEFIVYFKEKYLKNIQFETETKTRMLVKHALDIYRSKGTERSLDLLFRIVFGVGANFYYPGDDLFKPSDGVWYVPKYLEVSLNNNTEKFVNKQIVGLTSGATAFAESLIRRTVKDRFIDVLYISAINGNFQTNEVINIQDGTIPNDQAPRIIGSLTTLEVDADGVSELYSVGDEVVVSSNTGEQAVARVTSVSDIVGLVNFESLNTGYAYTSEANVFISELVLVLDGVEATNPLTYYDLFETVSQPLANIEYRNANNTFVVGANVYTYFANNLLQGQGSILSISTINSTAGTLLCRYDSGDLDSTQVYTDANAMSANIHTFLDVTATGTVIAYSANVTLRTSNLVGTFINGEEVFQFGIVNGINVKSSNATLSIYTPSVGSNGIMTLANAKSAFVLTEPIYGATSNAVANITNVSFNMGYVDGNNSFTALSNNFLVGNTLSTNATIVAIGEGSGASFSLSNTLIYSEDVVLYTDIISTYASTPLNALAYGFPANTSANLASIIGDTLAQNTFTIGRPSKLTNINKGSGYNIPPFALVYEPRTFPFHRYGRAILTLDINPYIIGEVVTQDDVNSRGVVIGSEGNKLIVDDLRFNPNNEFIISSNSTTILIGDQSAAEANVLLVEADVTQGTFGFMGGNFTMTANTQTSEGAVTGLKVIDSGFGFYDGQQVQFQLEGLGFGGAVAQLMTNGQGIGRYKQIGGFLSDQKKIFDGLYYQDFSYEVRSSLMLVKYEDMLKQLLHVVGTKYFGAFIKETEINSTLDVDQTIITSG